MTHGPYDHQQTFSEGASQPPSWSPDGKAIIFSANRQADAEYSVFNTDVYEASIADGAIKALTDRKGPDDSPSVSPDGKLIAYLGFDDKRLPYQSNRLSLMNRDGSDKRVLDQKLDREVNDPVWSKDGSGLYFRFADQGNTKVGFIGLNGAVRTLATNVGGTEISRPYSSGSFSVSDDGTLAFTLTTPGHPADVAVCLRGESKVRRLTTLNDGWLPYKSLGSVEIRSSRPMTSKIQG